MPPGSIRGGPRLAWARSVERDDHGAAADAPDLEPSDRGLVVAVTRPEAARGRAIVAVVRVSAARESIATTAAEAGVVAAHRVRDHALAGAEEPQERRQDDQLEPAVRQARDDEADRGDARH